MNRLICILSFIGVLGCSPVLNEKYSYVRKQDDSNEHLSFSFTFNKLNSTFLYSSKHLSDSVFGYYNVNGNLLVLEEFSRNWNCDSRLGENTSQFKFVSKYDSLPLTNQVVYINNNRYETDVNGVIQVRIEDSQKLEIRPILFKPFLLESPCHNMTFYMEQIYFQNPSLLKYKIRKERITSMEGNTYHHVP